MGRYFRNSNDTKYFVKRFAAMASTIAVFVTIVFIVAIAITVRWERNKIKIEQQNNVMLSKNGIEQWLDEAVLDLRVMTNSHFFIRFFSGDFTNQENAANFNDLSRSLLSEKRDYYQLRYIDSSGMEVFRIDQRDSLTDIVSEKGLQDKSSRYYFKNTIGLEKGDMYVSPLDLNMEYGEVEKPFRPMIRICMPVYNLSDKKLGIIVLNYDVTRLLTNFKSILKTYNGSNYLVNSDGFFLSAPDASIEWGFMFSDKNCNRLSDVFSADAKQLALLSDGQVESEKGLFTIASVFPFSKVANNSSTSSLSTSYFWKIVTLLPNESLTVKALVPITKIILLFIVVLLSGMVFAYLFAWVSLKRFQVLNELMSSEESLRVSNQTKDRLFSILAHDLRSPMGSLKTSLELILGGVIDPKEDSFVPFVQSLSRTTDAAFALLENLLGWSKSQSNSLVVSKANVNINSVLDSILALTKLNLSNKNIRINVELDPSLDVYADEQMVHIIIRNLLSNAVKFTPENGLITISAKTETNNAVIVVKDNGVGISEANVKSLFNDNNQLKSIGTNKEYGSGLGLVLCKEFVEKNGGQIRVESEIGKGTSFIFTLPLA